MTTHVTIRSGDRDYPALVVDAIGGEPATVMSGDAHVKILTWHGIAEPHTDRPQGRPPRVLTPECLAWLLY